MGGMLDDPRRPEAEAEAEAEEPDAFGRGALVPPSPAAYAASAVSTYRIARCRRAVASAMQVRALRRLDAADSGKLLEDAELMTPHGVGTGNTQSVGLSQSRSKHPQHDTLGRRE